jgi:hypothetical protein
MPLSLLSRYDISFFAEKPMFKGFVFRHRKFQRLLLQESGHKAAKDL